MNLIVGQNRITAMALILIAAAVISCSESKSGKAYVTFYTGTVTVRKAGGSPAPVQLKDQVNDGDILSTGQKSCIIIQNTEGLVIRLEQNTEAVISSFNNIIKKEINLNSGTVLSSVSKLKKGWEYSIKTPTTVASVRGTEFLTAFNGKDSIVAVGSGKVTVKRITGSGDEKLVEHGFTALAAGKRPAVELRKINKVEALELSKFKKTPVVDTIEKKTTDELKEIFKETKKTDEKINDEIGETIGLTLDEMRVKYGRIDTLYLYNGSILEGVIATRGNVYKIVTKSGIVMVDSKDIKNTATRK